MQAVILAAGKGTRCYPLTLTRPKVLLKVANKTLIEHNLEQLEGLVNEVIIVVGHMRKEVKECVGEKFRKIRIHYVEQKKQLGTGDALKSCEKLLQDRFIVISGDDLYSKKDIQACLKYKYAVLAHKVDDPEKWGIIEVKNEKVVKIVEKPKKFVSNLANAALYILDKSIFSHKLKKTKRNEYEATDYINYIARKEKVHCQLVQDYWIPVGYPWHLIEANDILLKRMRKSVIKGFIEKGVTIKGNIVLGEGSIIKRGSTIEGNVVIGKKSVIGPNCYIRGSTSVADNCKAGQGVEIKNSVLFENSKVPHISYVGDSVIGANVNLGAGTITANLRFDHGMIKTKIKGKMINSNRKKFGVIIGDGVQTGINVSLMPGVKIWPDARIKPHVAVYDDFKN